jgi:integrase/recombinase XerD
MKAYLEPEEISKIEETCTNFRDKLLIHLLFHSGCRITEALSIKVEDIDFDQHTITILHLKRRIKSLCPACGARLGSSHLFCPGCGSKIETRNTQNLENRRQRILPVDHETLNLLKEYIDRGGLVEKEGKKFIFNVNRHRGWQIVKTCAERASLEKLINPETGKVHNVSPHKLRDAFAINAMKINDSGDGLRLLQEHLGHNSFNTTAKYRKVAGEESREWYDRLWKKDKK